MKNGSLVETLVSFDDLKKEWGIDYPNKGDILVVSAITEHPNKAMRKKGIVLLHFEEKPGLPGICDKQHDGKDNFKELQPPMIIDIEIELEAV